MTNETDDETRDETRDETPGDESSSGVPERCRSHLINEPLSRPEEYRYYVQDIMSHAHAGNHRMAHKLEHEGYKMFVRLIATGNYDPETIDESAGRLLLADALSFERNYGKE